MRQRACTSSSEPTFANVYREVNLHHAVYMTVLTRHSPPTATAHSVKPEICPELTVYEQKRYRRMLCTVEHASVFGGHSHACARVCLAYLRPLRKQCVVHATPMAYA